jgi:hypothetical protein
MSSNRPFFGPIRTLIFAAALWLPLSFVVWFYFKQLFAFPVYLGAETVMKTWMPEIVTKVEAGYFAQEAVTGREPGAVLLGSYQHRFTINAPVPTDMPGMIDTAGKKMEVVVDINPLIYGYSVPLLIGLILVTPLTTRQRLLQIGLGLLILLPQQVYGVCVDLLQKLVFLGTPETAAVILSQGISKNMIALAYQFGYLMLPPVVPIMAWVLMNRDFVEKLVKADAAGEVWIDEDAPNKDSQS